MRRCSKNLIAIDLPSHGKSDEFPELSLDLYVDVVREFMDLNNYQKVVLCGHSLGGAVVQTYYFKYPNDFTVIEFSEAENTDTILVRKKDSKESFQIFINPFDEPGPLTKERVLEDLPDLIIKNPEQRVLKNGAVALIFFSEEPSIGTTREIWFIYNNYLYQVSTYKELDSLVASILSTWRFQ